MTRHASTALATALALGLFLTGCSGVTTPASAPPSADGTKAPEGARDAGSAGVAVDEVTDGTWQVGDAGEVEFTADGGTLSLTGVQAADGWQERVTDEKPDEIEVHFDRDDLEWKFEAEFEHGELQISKELKIRDAGSASFDVGSAASLVFTVDGDALAAADVAPADGWSITDRDESPDDIELDFRDDDGRGKAEFEAEIGRTGVQIEISQKLRGPVG